MTLDLAVADHLRAGRPEPPAERLTSPFERVAQTIRLVLCMIVRNEAAVIGRCLETALPHVDGFVVCDTGSTDDTVRIVEETARRYGVPGRVARHPWRNFGHNRTLSAKEARDWVMQQGWPTAETYLVHLDADMVLHVGPEFDRQTLTASSYDVIQDTGALHYWNVRLTRLTHVWSAIGATHEYWCAKPDGAIAARLDSIRIRDFGDGGGRAHKFERDVDLLQAELKRDPGNPRHTFYLAQSYFDTGLWEEAAEWYEARWRLDGWAEERWYARYRQGLSLLRSGDGPLGMSVLLDAFEERPSRAEPLLALARHCREEGKNQLALLFARRGLQLPYPAADVLFVEPEVYEWRLWEEVMISAWYAGPEHHPLGLGACERLRGQRGHETTFYPYVASNEVFYLPILRAAERGTLKLPHAPREHDGVVFQAANPTVARWRGELYANVRLLNYRLNAGGEYACLSPDGVFRSYNAAIPWAADGQDSQPIAIIRDVPADWPSDAWARGLEDIRWTVHQDRIWFTATSCQVPGAHGAPQVVLGRLNERLDAVEHLVPLKFDGAQPIEKNWLPWSVGDELRVIYSFDPFVVLRVDPVSGQTIARKSAATPLRAVDFRGGCAPIPFPDRSGRWLAVIHEVAAPSTGRVYWHRWIEIDEREGLTRYSQPFVFDHVGVEYAAGLAELDDRHVVVSYGFEDREARWVTCRWDEVVASLNRQPTDVEIPAPASFEQRSESGDADRERHGAARS